MKKKRFTEDQIIKILKEFENGRDITQLSREHGVSSTTIYNWRKKFHGMDSSQLSRLKELEDENRRLKQLYAEAALDIVVLKDVISKKW
jgi:putative transposase